MLSLLAISLLFVCFSCNNEKKKKTAADNMSTEKKDNSMTEKNLAASHIINDAFATGDISKIDEAVASDFIDHTDQGVKNRDSLKVMIPMMHKEFPDMGMPKGPYDMKAIEVVRFKDGKAAEHWSYMEPAEVMKMMGGQQPPMKMDDKKKK